MLDRRFTAVTGLGSCSQQPRSLPATIRLGRQVLQASRLHGSLFVALQESLCDRLGGVASSAGKDACEKRFVRLLNLELEEATNLVLLVD